MLGAASLACDSYSIVCPLNASGPADAGRANALLVADESKLIEKLPTTKRVPSEVG